MAAPMPPWLMEAMKSSDRGRTTRTGPAAPGEIIGEGGRNTYLTSLAGAMRRQGMTFEEIRAALLVVNDRCDPPLSEGEVEGIAKSVSRYPPEPRVTFTTGAKPSEPDVEDSSTSDHPADTFSPLNPFSPDQPGPISEEAYHGLAGRFVRAVEPASEASPVALLVQFLFGVGSLVGRTAHAVVEGDHHHTNEYAVLVGQSAKARKGTSWGRVKATLSRAEQQWADNRVMGGLSSGEGVIWNVRDPIEKQEKVSHGKGQTPTYETVVADPGEEDKRLLVVEPEFANVLKQTERQGNTLSAILRQGWETGNLRSLTKNSPAKASGAHITIVGHITDEELRRYLTATEAANGFGNRFMWFLVKRSKMLPDGGTPDLKALSGIESELAAVLDFARTAGRIDRDPDAADLWRQLYPVLSGDRHGLAGSLTGRAEAHVLRLSVIYAVLDRSPVVKVEHLTAAVAVWEYAEQSVLCIFGDSTGNPLADTILALLRQVPKGTTRTEIREMVGKNLPADRIGQALGLLAQMGLARCESRDTGGRPSELWFAVRKGAANG